VKFRGIRPPSNGEQHFDVTVLFLEVVDCFEVAVEVVPDIIPRVAGIVDVLVRPRIREDDLA